MRYHLVMALLGVAILASLTWPKFTAAQQPLTSQATTYYVATSGDDANSGAIDQPFATLNHAVDQVAAGDTILIRGGVYTLSEGVWLGEAGAASARIVIRAYPGETAILDGSQLPQSGGGDTCLSIGGQYIDVEGLEVRNCSRTGITAWEGSHVRIRNNKIYGCTRGGVYAGGSEKDASHILVEGNTVYDNCQENNPPPAGQGSGWPAAISMGERTRYFTVTNNLVYENYGEGIAFTMADDGLAAGNTLYDNYSVGIYLDNAVNCAVEGNLLYTQNNVTFYRFDKPANGIQISNETYDDSHLSQGIRIVNNIVIGARKNFDYGDFLRGGGLRDTTVANNTFYRGYDGVLVIDEVDNGSHANTTFTNNIFYQAGTEPLVVLEDASGLSFHHNSWFGGDPGLAAGSGDITADPLLVKPGGLTAGDYRLQAGSPALNGGDGAIAPATDYFGTARPAGSGYDIGAYEGSGLEPLYLPLILK